MRSRKFITITLLLLTPAAAPLRADVIPVPHATTDAEPEAIAAPPPPTEEDVCAPGKTVEACAVEKFQRMIRGAREIIQEDNRMLSELASAQAQIKNEDESIAAEQKELQNEARENQNKLNQALNNLPPSKAPESADPQQEGGGGPGGGALGGGAPGQQVKIPESQGMTDPPRFQVPQAPAEAQIPNLPSYQAPDRAPLNFAQSPQLPTDMLAQMQNSAQPVSNKKPLDVSPMAFATGDAAQNLGKSSALGSASDPNAQANQNLFGGGGGGGAQAVSPSPIGGGSTDGSSLNGVSNEGNPGPEPPSGIKTWDGKYGSGGDGGSSAGGAPGSSDQGGSESKSSAVALAALRAGEIRDAKPDPRAKGEKTVFAALERALGEGIDSGAIELKKATRSIASE